MLQAAQRRAAASLSGRNCRPASLCGCFVGDLRYAARALRRHPGFALVVLGTFALGIGMNTAVFSVANAVLFRTLPYPDADRLAWLTNFSLREHRDIFTPNAEYRSWKTQTRSFDRLAAYGDAGLAMLSGGRASQERIAFVTW
ncbi:MAG TPA: hypothetical protein VKV15_26930 [Bryobacteraceae bacterium]|nr:hypothetical protein [Bryobacteraceae bacterium]